MVWEKAGEWDGDETLAQQGERQGAVHVVFRERFFGPIFSAEILGVQ